LAATVIAVVSRAAWPAVHGGAELFATRVAEELAKQGHRVLLVTASNVSPSAVEVVRIDGVCRWMPLLRSICVDWEAAKQVARIEPDVVLVNAYWSSATAWFLRRLGYRGRVALIIHDLGLIHRRDSAGKQFRLWLLARSASASDVVIVPTERVAMDVARVSLASPDRIRVLGFEGVEAPMKRVHVENGFFDVVQVARFSPNKGQHVLLKAVDILLRETEWARRELRVVLVGGLTDRGYYQRLAAEAAEINARAGRRLIELRPNVKDVDPYYRVADVCVAASLGEEGYGIAVEECMGYGKPVVATTLFKMLGRIDEETGYIVPPGDPAALADALRAVHDKPDEALKKASRGLEKVRQHSWDKVASRILNLLD